MKCIFCPFFFQKNFVEVKFMIRRSGFRFLLIFKFNFFANLKGK